MTRPDELDDAENWRGGFYELAIELGPPDDRRLGDALQVVWAEAPVDGCVTIAGHDPLRHEPAEPTGARWRGTACAA